MMIFWLVLLILLLILEGITTSLTSIWFAGGALVSAILAFAEVGIVMQFVVFLIVSIVLLVLTRPFVKIILKTKYSNTNIDSLIGKKTVVTESVNNLSQTGRVKINDVDWMARTKEDNETIPEGTVVVITKIEGTKLIVKKENKQE